MVRPFIPEHIRLLTAAVQVATDPRGTYVDTSQAKQPRLECVFPNLEFYSFNHIF